ncbi:MAG: Uncharacterized protein XD63_0598 [Thermoanaerobacterales bacterium 50_218]|nr:MAG: Uncharacterized protein XD63_0598 [Thermoanaerobacterales bacterium 50_218]
MEPRKKRLLFVAGLVGLLLGILFLPLQIKIWKLEKEIVRLEETKKMLQQEHSRLEQDLQYYSSDAYVEEFARRELGLVKPGELLVIPALPGKVQPPPEGLDENPYEE